MCQTVDSKIAIDTSGFSCIDSSFLFDAIKPEYIKCMAYLSDKYDVNIHSTNPKRHSLLRYKLSSKVEANQSNQFIEDNFKYKLVIKLTDYLNSRILVETVFTFKNLQSQKDNQKVLNHILVECYENIFAILAHREHDIRLKTFNKFSRFLIVQNDSTSLPEEMKNFLDKYINNCKFETNYNCEEVDYIFCLSQKKINGGMLLNFQNTDDVNICVDSEHKNLEIFITDSEIKSRDFAFLYGKLKNFIFKISNKNF